MWIFFVMIGLILYLFIICGIMLLLGFVIVIIWWIIFEVGKVVIWSGLFFGEFDVLSNKIGL